MVGYPATLDNLNGLLEQSDASILVIDSLTTLRLNQRLGTGGIDLSIFDVFAELDYKLNEANKLGFVVYNPIREKHFDDCIHESEARSRLVLVVRSRKVRITDPITREFYDPIDNDRVSDVLFKGASITRAADGKVNGKSKTHLMT